MNILPIPKKLLIHNVIYLEKGESNGWDNVLNDPVEINYVRVTPKNRFERKQNAEGIYATHVMLVDRINSSAFPNFKAGSTIKWFSKDYEISEVTPAYDDKEIHHYEVGMILK